MNKQAAMKLKLKLINFAVTFGGFGEMKALHTIRIKHEGNICLALGEIEAHDKF